MPAGTAEGAAVDVDRAGIARSSRAMGGEGTNLLLLRTPSGHDSDTLDAALPPDHGDSPANGGWFPGPQGWMLLVEGLDEQVDPWIEQLAARLSAAGVDGTLTGATTASEPIWARRMEDGQTLNALIGFRPQPGFRLRDGWVCGPASLAAAVDIGMGWLTAHGGKVMAVGEMSAQFWVDPATAASMMASEGTRTGRALSSSYQSQRQEVRNAVVGEAAGLTLSSRHTGYPWREMVDELRSALLATPLDRVSVAMVSHREWATLVYTDIPGSEYYHRFAYEWHPERWDEFILDPCGIQILTNRHLAAAGDLSAWSTTRLDGDHVLVEARDLDPWFAAPLRTFDPLDPELIDQARRDFGDMILTPDRAEALGLTTKPDHRSGR